MKKDSLPLKKSKKKYTKPKLEKMNDKVGHTSGAPAVPGATAAAHVSPIAPGMTVF
ncbi:MAG: hypothetical protein KDD48_01515 [Bdellovibrionales bacterium]|nr:hypothetical protein [Bdellovibrionales bacterium]